MSEDKPSISKLPATNNSSEFKIGILLIKSGKLTAENAREVAALSNLRSIRFGDAALELGFVTEEDIEEVVAKQFDYTHLTFNDAFSPSLVSAFHPRSAEAEFIRGLRTQLMLDWFKKDGNKSLAVSSIDEGSGNSRFVANTAVSFSQLGKKTLLIDANLRRPTLHQIFNLNSYERGLSDVLIGRAGLDAVREIKAINNFSLLPAGAIPPNPQELVASKMFEDLLTFLNEIFDIILIDTPAFSISADAQVIGAAAGGTLLVIRKHVTKASQVTAISNMLVSNGTAIVGSVVTDF